jgi:N-acetylneuraminic acid mutarotase
MRCRAFAASLALLVVGGAGCYRLFPDQPYVGPWKRGAPSPILRVEAPGCSVGGRLYVFGGFDSDELTVSRRVDVYDPAADRWSRAADLPLEVTHVMAAVDGERVWLAGGFLGRHPGRAIADVLVYDSARDAWSAGPPLPAARAAGALVRSGRSLHYFGGFVDRDATSGSHWELPLDDPAPAWRERAPLPEPRGHLAAAAVGERILALGGQRNHDRDREDLAFVHAYDPAADRWSERATLPTPRSHFDVSTIVAGGRVAIFGGRNEGRLPFWSRGHPLSAFALREVTVYDPDRDAWSERPRLPLGLLGPTAAVVDDRVVVVGGSSHMTAFPQDDTYLLPVKDLLGE